MSNMKHENPSPEYIAAEAGVKVANEANKAFDDKVSTHADLVALERVNNIPGVSVSDETYATIENREGQEYDRFDRFVGIAGDLIGRNTLGEKALYGSGQVESDPVAKPEAKAETSVFDQLSAEQQEKATKLTTAMAEKFGVSKEDFSVLRTTAEDGSDRFTLAYTAGNGLDMANSKEDYDPRRSWNGLFDKKADKNFMIEVDGQKIDSRTGMTEAAYDAFIADAKARGDKSLPDSQPLANENGELWTATWLTGEKAARGHARVADVRVDRVSADWYDRGDGGRVRRFRPAVVIE